jgi:hypothetical protein
MDTAELVGVLKKTAKLSKPVQGSLEAHREAALRQEDEKKREAQSAGAKKTLKKIAAANAKKKRKTPEGDVEAPAPKQKQKKQPVEDPAPAARELQNVDSNKEGDEDYNPEQWTVTDHAIDDLDGEPKFQAVTGRREDGSDKTFWGLSSEATQATRRRHNRHSPSAMVRHSNQDHNSNRHDKNSNRQKFDSNRLSSSATSSATL